MDPRIKILLAADMRACDLRTMKEEPVSSSSLMERASWRLFQSIRQEIQDNEKLHIVSGPGNNGGDGVCLARYFHAAGYNVSITVLLFGKTPSRDLELQLNICRSGGLLPIHMAERSDELILHPGQTIIDAIFGTGLTEPLSGDWAKAVNRINASGSRIISIDMPSGLTDTGSSNVGPVIRAAKVFTIQCPKPSLLYAENHMEFAVTDAGIDLSAGSTDTYYLDPEHSVNAIRQWLPKRPRHSHKGTYGHTLLIGGNTGMHGAIALAAEACYHAGSGLTTVWSPESSAPWLGSMPQIMFHAAPLESYSLPSGFPDKFGSIAIGPGLGTSHASLELLEMVIRTAKKPLILDADALNLLAAHPPLLKAVPEGSLLTPHPGEFRRLFGETSGGRDMELRCRKTAMETGLYLLAKNTYSMLATPSGEVIYNGSGSAALSQGGSGDRLTGMIAGFYAQNRDMRKAAACGMFFAGLGVTSPHGSTPA